MVCAAPSLGWVSICTVNFDSFFRDQKYDKFRGVRMCACPRALWVFSLTLSPFSPFQEVTTLASLLVAPFPSHCTLYFLYMSHHSPFYSTSRFIIRHSAVPPTKSVSLHIFSKHRLVTYPPASLITLLHCSVAHEEVLHPWRQTIRHHRQSSVSRIHKLNEGIDGLK